MKRSHRTNQDMQCPNCKGHNTQSIAIAYSQSVRTGDTGRQTISEFGQGLAPPMAKDEKLVPGIIACVVLGVCLFTLPDLLNRTGIPALTDLSVVNWKVAAISCLAAWTVGLLVAIPRIRYNVMELPSLLDEWERDAICRRCGHRWQSLSSPKSDKHGEYVG